MSSEPGWSKKALNETIRGFVEFKTVITMWVSIFLVNRIRCVNRLLFVIALHQTESANRSRSSDKIGMAVYRPTSPSQLYR
jgi:hypothetical protein